MANAYQAFYGQNVLNLHFQLLSIRTLRAATMVYGATLKASVALAFIPHMLK